VGAFVKMALSSGFVAAALAAGALDTSWGTWLLAGLTASWLGDLSLIGRSRTAFIAGLGAFTAAHVCYLVAFIARGIDPTAAVAGAAIMAVAGAGVLVWLRGYGVTLLPALAVYVTALAAMVAGAIGTHSHQVAWALAVGAIGFAASDVAVARDRFVAPGNASRRWGLPLYFASQFLIAIAAGG
jgi:uncharacterized membrane protein YhhN